MSKNKIVLLITCLFLVKSILAQDNNNEKSKSELRKEQKALPPKKGEVFIIATPIVSINPAFGFMYGAGSVISLFLGDPATTSISSGSASISYTTKNQLLTYVNYIAYTENNKWILNGDWRYLNSSQPTFGLGTGPESSKLASNGFEYNDHMFSKPISGAQDMSFRFIRIYETVSMRLTDNLYIGIGYHLDMFSHINDKLLDLTSEPPVITSFHAYNLKYGYSQTSNSVSGMSLNVSYDSRDNQNNAYIGDYASISFRINPAFLGSEKNSTMLMIDYRRFIDLTKDHRNMLCVWGLVNLVTSGTVPYMALPALGEDQNNKTGRGYAQGRFRGQKLLYGELEYRKHLISTRDNPDFMGMVLFVNSVTATNPDAGIPLFKYLNMGAGTGLRIMISKKARTNFGIDYGIGNYGSGGIYLKLNESF
jgi:outer membrane protein assembly factor BamA